MFVAAVVNSCKSAVLSLYTHLLTLSLVHSRHLISIAMCRRKANGQYVIDGTHCHLLNHFLPLDVEVVSIDWLL